MSAVLAVLILLANVPAWAQTQDTSAVWLSQWVRKRPVLSRIEMSGNKAIKTKGLRAVMQVVPAGFWSRLRLKSQPLLHPTMLRREETNIQREYRRQGYWDARVSVMARPYRDDGHAVMRVFVEEGMRSFWGGMVITGTPPELAARLHRYSDELVRGKPADSLLLALIVVQMQAECADRGHPLAHIAATVAHRADTIDVAFTLESGSEISIGKVSIDGLKGTRLNVVMRELRFKPGELYSRTRLVEKQQDLYSTGLFALVRISPEYTDTNSGAASRVADLNVRLVERPPSYIGFHTGAGQDPDRDLTLDYAVEWGSRNWLGTGRRWALTAQSGFVIITEWRVLHHRFSGRYTEPWIFGLRLPTTLTLAYEPGVRSPTQNYRIEKMSGELNVTRRFRKYNRVWSALVYERVNIYGIPADQRQSLLDEAGITIKRRGTLALERDTRPNLFLPSSGARTRIDFDYVGGILGGAIDFYKLDFSWARYQVISAPTIMATRLRAGWAGLHSGGKLIPTADRFYLGGANSIRGYSENSVGPADTLGNPTGGLVIALANFELRTPMTGKFWFTLFGDAGNNWDSFHDVTLKDMLISLGVGVQYVAPVGPLRLDYARRVIHPGYPRSDRVHLSILFAF
ncbi:MAG: BamA/TamA family outer membrane protein [candidate division Zixibacteria bacterium]|nr:BamA/TamA family outer membrane protein [candidate division Zixibacteria bacterium]